VTAFAERIAERPPIYDEARGADILQTLTKAFDASDALAPAARLLAERPDTAEPDEARLTQPAGVGDDDS
jgi:hypothetical protein